MTKILFTNILQHLETVIEKSNTKLWKNYYDSGSVPLISISSCYVPTKLKSGEIELEFWSVELKFTAAKTSITIFEANSFDDESACRSFAYFETSEEVMAYFSEKIIPQITKHISSAIKLHDSLS